MVTYMQDLFNWHVIKLISSSFLIKITSTSKTRTMKNRSLQHVSSWLINMGINVQEDSSETQFWKFIIILMNQISVIATICMTCVTNYNDFNKFVTPVSHIASATVVLSVFQISYLHRKTIGKMLRLLYTKLYVYPDEHLLEIDYKWYLQENAMFVLINLSFFGHIFIVVMLLSSGFGELIFYGRITTFVYPTWTPWQMDNVQTELLTYVLQIFQSFCCISIGHVVTIFIAVVVVEFVKQYERLDFAISSLTERTSLSDRKTAQDELLRENIIHCIRHYEALHKCFVFFKIWFTSFFSFELALYLLTMVFALYVLMNALNVFELWNFFTIFLFIWGNLVIRCFISEIFFDMNENLADTIYWQVEWLKSNNANRRLHLMFPMKLILNF